MHAHYHTLASLLSIFFLSDFYVISFLSYLLLLFLLAFRDGNKSPTRGYSIWPDPNRSDFTRPDK